MQRLLMRVIGISMLALLLGGLLSAQVLAQTQSPPPSDEDEEEPEEIELADGPWIGELGRCRDLNEEEATLVRVDFKDANGNVRDKRKYYVRWETLNDKTGHWVVLGIWCPHLKCAVDYIEEVGVYDCPCCNSQFALDGRVITGRAKEPLVNYSDEVYTEGGLLMLEVEPKEERP